ncbi:MAG: VUT family protein, partial [bacterium]
FFTIAFLGTMPMDKFFQVILAAWMAKIIYEVVALPVTMPFSNWVKRFEGMDVIDNPKTTHYNPFSTE